MHNPDEFQQIAIMRDLVRRPEIRTLALILAKMGATGPVDRNDIPAIWVMLAHKLITNKSQRQMLYAALEALGE